MSKMSRKNCEKQKKNFPLPLSYVHCQFETNFGESDTELICVDIVYERVLSAQPKDLMNKESI